MKTFEFTVIASGLHPEMAAFEDRFFDAGCDDSTIAFQKGVVILEFSREADSFSRAVATAYENVRAAGATVERIEPDHLVSLSDIAERAGLTRQAMSLYSKAERGEGFPSPVARITSKVPLWDWSEVAEWLFERQKIDQAVVIEAKIVREANLFIGSHDVSLDNFRRHLEALAA